MDVTNIIVVGPKKTGSTTFYEWLHHTYNGPLTLLNKERNGLYSDSEETLIQNYSKGVIEICPDYFADMRAFLRLRRLSERHGLQFRIVILHRDPERRLRSHITYMLNEGVITPRLAEPEVTTILLQAQEERFRALWTSAFPVTLLDMSDRAGMTAFTQPTFDMPFEYDKRENAAGGRAGSVKTHLLRPLATALYRVGGGNLVEAIRRTGFVERLTHSSVSEQEKDVIEDTIQQVMRLHNNLQGHDTQADPFKA